MNSYVKMCNKHEKEYRNDETRIIVKDGNNVKWDFGTFEKLRKFCKSTKATIQALKVLSLLVRSRQLDPATLPFVKVVK